MYHEPPSLELNPVQARAFCAEMEERTHPIRSLADINAAIVDATVALKDHPFLAAAVQRASEPLVDPEVGIVAVDIPSGLDEDRNRDALLGCLVSTAIVNLISPTVPDKRNGSPFTLYNASRENESQLKKAGVRYYSPEDRLGFHSDGLLHDGAVLIPDHVSVYNLLVAYRRPGNFYFLPLALWDEYESFRARIGIGRDYRFALTPIVYADKTGGIEATKSRHLTAPIFSEDESGRKLMFFNGEIEGESDAIVKAVQEMKESLLNNDRRIAIPIRNRRLFIMANDLGLHARDIFEEPIEGAAFTRSFLRYVSSKGGCVSANGVEDEAPLQAVS